MLAQQRKYHTKYMECTKQHGRNFGAGNMNAPIVSLLVVGMHKKNCLHGSK